MDFRFLFLAAWRLVGILGIFFLAPHGKVFEEHKVRLLGIIRKRTVYLFFVPWFLFTIVNFVEQPLVEHYFGAELYNQYMMAGILVTSLSAFLAHMFYWITP